jgi:hypothetical protein
MCGYSTFKSPFDPFANHLPEDSKENENPISIFYLLIFDIFTIHSPYSFLQELWEREKVNNTIRMARVVRA